jgi:21S rRNA (GM2251-2'-O)-methyltransferase
MRQFNSLCSQYRHSVLLQSSWRLFGVGHVPVRYSSLSAIHRGLRDSEKTRPQGFAQGALNTTGSGRTPRSTSRSRRGTDWEAPDFKLKRGKKDVTDKGPQPKSRRLRFNDPTESFGKKSLVYKLKHGELREKLAELDGDTKSGGRDQDVLQDNLFSISEKSRPKTRSSGGRGGSGDSFGDKFADKFENKFSAKSESRFDSKPRGDWGSKDSDRSSRKPASSRFQSRAPRERESRFDSQSTRGSDRPERREHSRIDPAPAPDKFEDRFTSTSFGSKDSGRQSNFKSTSFGDKDSERSRREFEPRSNETRGFSRTREDRDRRPRFVSAAESPRRDFGSQFNNPPPRDIESGDDVLSFRKSSPRDDLPVRIHHTTAASHFLYGRSVVEAALKDSRRQIYRLYIYAGEDRRNVSQDTHLENLANEKDILVVKVVDRDGLRAMDKMSGGRPHNGCVLEASPLPQLPLKSLGALSEDPDNPGFGVELAHQSNEEEAINGTSSFITYRPRRGKKPFILLLDGILDPGNLGAILRSAAFLGVTGVVITKHSSATLTPVALKASAGASEVLSLYSVTSTIDFIERSKEAGWMVYASVAAGPRSRGNSHLTVDRLESYDPLSMQPTILVIGSEGEGLGKPIKRVADFEVSIPGESGFLSTVDSLNVSVATGILCAAFLKKPQGVEIEETINEPKEGDESQLW